VQTFPSSRLARLLTQARQIRILVLGDVMLDQFIWGEVNRISPEAPVPVVQFQRENSMPGGAANVARNLTALGVQTELFTVIGRDDAGRNLRRQLEGNQVCCDHLLVSGRRPTSIKTRIIAHQQQVVRVDRESLEPLDARSGAALLNAVESRLPGAAALVVGDYGKGIVTQWLLDKIKALCRQHGVWLSLDPKPAHRLDLSGLSLITPNRKEAFELADVVDNTRAHPLADRNLLLVGDRLLERLAPALLLITLGEQGMLLCRKNHPPFHIPTVAREVFDVSGAGDTVIATFTLAVGAGGSPIEAAVLSNHAGGVVVGKVGTATVSPGELVASFRRAR